MPGREPLSSLVNFEALQAETDRVIGLVRSIQEALDNVGKANSLFKNAKGATEQKAATDGLIESNEQLLKAQKALNAEDEKTKTMQGELAKQLAIKKELNKQAATDMRAEAREAAGLNDAYRKLELQYNAAQRAAKNLAATPGTPKQAIEEANSKALALSNQLKAIDAAVGQHQRNVGNYSGALKTLEQSLNEAKERMEQLIQAGQAGSQETEQLASEITLLGQLVSQQSAGFTSLSREIMATGKALETMAQNGMEGTEAFERLEEQYVKARRELNEFRKDQQLLTSEAPRLAALTLAAKGLGGAYAIGAGASALFADGNEKVEKELNKLVAIMTILQGLQEFHELIEKRTAVATLASGVAQQFKNFIMGKSTSETKANTEALMENVGATEAEVAADTERIEAEEAATAATAENTVASEEQAVATDAVAVATQGVSRAMIGLRIALIATGIGALLILLPMIANAMGLFKKNTEETAKEMAALAEAIQKVNDAIIAQAELSNQSLKDQKKLLEAQLEYAQKAGKDFYTQIELKKKINELDQKMAENNLKSVSGQNDITKAIQNTMIARNRDANELMKLQAIQQNQEQVHADALKKGDAESEKSFNERQESRQKEIESAKKKLESDIKLLEDYDNAEKDHNSLRIEEGKTFEEEQRKLLATTIKDKAERIEESNNLILSGERANLEDRIAAMRSNLEQQKKIIEAEKNEKLGDPSLTPAGRALAEKEAGQAEYIATIENKERIRKVIDEYYKRNRDAAIEIQKSQLEDEIKTNEDSLLNEKLTYNQRIALISDSYLKQRVISGAEMMKQLDNENLTGEERKAIIAKYDSEILALTEDFHKKQEEEGKKAHQKAIADAIAQGDERRAKILAAEAEANIKANNSTGNNFGEALAKKRKDLAFEYNEQILQNQIQTDFLLVNSEKEGTKARAEAEQKLAEDRMKLSNMIKDKSIADEKERTDKIRKYSKEGAEVAMAAVEQQFQRQINRIDKIMAADNRRYQEEKANIDKSTLNAQQKAAALNVIDQQQRNQEKQLQQEKRREQVKEARFEQIKSIFEISANTATAIMEAVKESPTTGGLPWSAIAAGIGAAQIAAVLARPLPTFAKGTDSAPAGWGIWGEAGQEAKIDRRGRVELSAGPSLTRFEGGERIIPHDELNKIMYNNMLQATTWVIPARQDESAKEIRRLQGIVQEQSDRQRQEARNKTVPRVTIKINPGWDAYIRKSVKE